VNVSAPCSFLSQGVDTSHPISSETSVTAPLPQQSDALNPLESRLHAQLFLFGRHCAPAKKYAATYCKSSDGDHVVNPDGKL
jgi:hypothetical protein